jgi:dUTP pyrophosphatase
MISIKKLDSAAVIPTKSSEQSAGFDLTTIESVTIPPGQRALLRTGLAFNLPSGTVGLIWPRSKLAAKYGIDVLAGVIDSNYTGQVMASLLNTSAYPVEISKGDKVAQMIIQEHVTNLVFTEVEDLPDTERGSKGVNCSELRRKG